MLLVGVVLSVSPNVAPVRGRKAIERREHQKRQRARALIGLDALLDRIEASHSHPSWLPEVDAYASPACGTRHIHWANLPDGCDPCDISRKMGATKRGERKRESVAAFAWLLERVLLPQVTVEMPTIVDLGTGTGSLLLPLAAIFPHATFIGVDTKVGSLDRLRARADAAGPEVSGRVHTWQGRIEDFDGRCDVAISLHACGSASDASLRLAVERRVPFAVSPCCVGKVSTGTRASSGRGALSPWLQELTEPEGFRLLAKWADAVEHAAPIAPAGREHLQDESASRRRRCKRIVELDRLASLGADAGRLLRIDGPAMASSGQTELLTGPPSSALLAHIVSIKPPR